MPRMILDRDYSAMGWGGRGGGQSHRHWLAQVGYHLALLHLEVIAVSELLRLAPTVADEYSFLLRNHAVYFGSPAFLCPEDSRVYPRSWALRCTLSAKQPIRERQTFLFHDEAQMDDEQEGPELSMRYSSACTSRSLGLQPVNCSGRNAAKKTCQRSDGESCTLALLTIARILDALLVSDGARVREEYCVGAAVKPLCTTLTVVSDCNSEANATEGIPFSVASSPGNSFFILAAAR